MATKGSKLSEETKMKMSESKRKQHQDLEFRQKFMLGQKRRHEKAGNKLESEVKQLFDEIGFSYEEQKIIKNKYLVDFYIPEMNMLVEVDGAIHKYKERQVRDKVRDSFFVENEFDIVHLDYKKINKLRKLLSKISKGGGVI